MPVLGAFWGPERILDSQKRPSNLKLSLYIYMYSHIHVVHRYMYIYIHNCMHAYTHMYMYIYELRSTFRLSHGTWIEYKDFIKAIAQSSYITSMSMLHMALFSVDMSVAHTGNEFPKITPCVPATALFSRVSHGVFYWQPPHKHSHRSPNHNPKGPNTYVVPTKDRKQGHGRYLTVQVLTYVATWTHCVVKRLLK